MVSKKACQFSTLALNGLRLTVRLGCSAKEREIPQFVRFDVRLRFDSLPDGCESDSLEETICFDRLSTVVRSVCDRQAYHLIEKLGCEVFKALKEVLPVQTELWVQTTKEKPPVPNLEGGASFCLGDWSEH